MHNRSFLGRLVAPFAGATAGALLASLGCVSPAAAAAPDPVLVKKLTTIMSDRRVQQATSATVVVDGSTGSLLYTRFGSRPTTPASNTKILTAVAAMNNLGPNYRFKTDAIVRAIPKKGLVAGNLYLKGYGDPTSRVADFGSLARQVRASGVRRVTGGLIVDASFFDSVRYNPTWSKSYASGYYAGQISALTVSPNSNFNSGALIVSYQPAALGKKAKVMLSPAAAGQYVTIINKTKTVSRGTASTFSLHRAWGTNDITVRGRVPLGGRVAGALVTVNKPELYAGAVFRAELVKVGVKVAGSTRAARTPSTWRHLMARDTSMTLSKLLVPFLKLSNNMHAEALTKAMGARQGRPGNWQDGLSFTRGYLQSLGVPMSGIKLTDGSGLTRSNKITARALSAVLYRVQREKWFPAFYAALPIAGSRQPMIGGTLRNRMNGTRAANNAHAKTGTLTGVTALSGYVKGADGRRYVFSMLSENKGATPRPVENTLVIALASWRRWPSGLARPEI